MNISKEKKAEALKIKAAHGYKEIYVNNKGEFFSMENYASMSVDGDRKRYMKVEAGTEANKPGTKTGAEDEGDKSKSTS
jgi:hypothetical protein